MTTAAPFLSDHTAHLIGATIIIGALLWMAADVAWFIAGLVVERHVQRALGDDLGQLDCYHAAAVVALRPFFDAWDQSVKEDHR